MTITSHLYAKLCKARDTKSIVISTSTAIKAFALKYVEVLHHMDMMTTGRNMAWGGMDGM